VTVVMEALIVALIAAASKALDTAMRAAAGEEISDQAVKDAFQGASDAVDAAHAAREAQKAAEAQPVSPVADPAADTPA